MNIKRKQDTWVNRLITYVSFQEKPTDNFIEKARMGFILPLLVGLS